MGSVHRAIARSGADGIDIVAEDLLIAAGRAEHGYPAGRRREPGCVRSGSG
jgi:hypothetical protein